MTLTTNGKNYISNKFGTLDCFVYDGLTWSYLDVENNTVYESGGTAQIVSRLIMEVLVQSVTIDGITYVNSQLTSANDGNLVTLVDTKWIADNDGIPVTEPQYCMESPILTYIIISPSSITLNIDNTKQLSAICKDQYNKLMSCPTLTWSSTNPSVATVDSNGVVTGISIGTTDITASALGITSNISNVTVTDIVKMSGDSTTLIIGIGLGLLYIIMKK